MNPIALEKLQWPVLLAKLASLTQSSAGKVACSNLRTDLSHEEIEESWQQTHGLKSLIHNGYVPPIGEVPDLEGTFRGAKLGQVLDGPSLRDIYSLLDTAKNVQRFTSDFVDRCTTLLRFDKTIYPLPNLAKAIEDAISPEGEILDTASAELMAIRRKKLSLRKTIESQIKSLLSDNEMETYLQDKFFTLRSERYVVPMKLDGRGRVKGSIHDTSDSGQTLYIEPESIKPHNEKLLELDLNEKLEILRIFRELSQHVTKEWETLDNNYRRLIELDILTAKGRLASNLDAAPVQLSQEPCLRLMNARHPLVTTPSGGGAVANNISLEDKHRVLIVSGPNAGGKTIVLKTVGLLHIMAKAGLLIPADESSKIYLPKNIYLEMGDSQSLEANLSTFSGHLMGLKPILEKSGPADLVLLDELAVGTDPQTGAAIGQAVLEAIAKRNSIGLVTTHFDNLKGLAMSDERFRNGSMEFSIKSLKPSYKLVLDIPGQSYGLEVAEQMGLPIDLIHRAKELRGNSSTEMDKVIEDMMTAKEEAAAEKKRFEQLRLDMEAQKFRWEKDREVLLKAKEKASEKIKGVYQDQIDRLKMDFRESADQFKKIMKKVQKSELMEELKDQAKSVRKETEDRLSRLESNLHKLGDEYKHISEEPGVPVDLNKLQVGAKVYLSAFDQEGVVTKVQVQPPVLEVTAGLLKIKPALHEVRLLEDKASKKKKPPTPKKKSATKPGEVAFTIPSPTNSLDLRGHDETSALNKTWDFIDKAVLRGETQLIIIHGHGTAVLKRAVRTALGKDSPYDLDFRPGEKEEGGDGVTVVQLKL